jgi:hypothetical protein
MQELMNQPLSVRLKYIVAPICSGFLGGWGARGLYTSAVEHKLLWGPWLLVTLVVSIVVVGVSTVASWRRMGSSRQ